MVQELDVLFSEFKEKLIEDKKYWYDFLRSWCNGYYFLKDTAIIGGGKTGRMICHNVGRLYGQLINFGATGENRVALSLYSFRDTNKEYKLPKKRLAPRFGSANFNLLWYDFDCDHKDKGGLEDALNDVAKMYDRYRKWCRVYFTGGRGFHLYVDLDADIGFRLSRIFRERMMGIRKFPTVDRAAGDSPSQCAQLPYTLRPDTRRYCIPIDVNWDMDEILARSEVYTRPEPVVKKRMRVTLMAR